MIKKTEEYKKLVKKKAKKKSKRVDSDGYKKQLVGNKKMPKAVGNDSDESFYRTFSMEDRYTHYAPKMEKGYFDKDGGGVRTERNQTNESQKKKYLASRNKKRLTPSKPLKGYKAPKKGYTSGSY